MVLRDEAQSGRFPRATEEDAKEAAAGQWRQTNEAWQAAESLAASSRTLDPSLD